MSTAVKRSVQKGQRGLTPTVRFRQPSVVPPPVDLDEVQRGVVARPRGAGPLVVFGAPGTGKTTTMVEVVAHQVEHYGVCPSKVVALAPTRRLATDLRERLSDRLQRATQGQIARSPHALAFEVLRRVAVARQQPAPSLISGPDQDHILAELLEGHRLGEGLLPQWPRSLQQAVGLSGFRDELRDLVMRALERDITPHGLRDLADAEGRPEWRAAADVFEEYVVVTAFRNPPGFDPAGIIPAAVSAIRANDGGVRDWATSFDILIVDDFHEASPPVQQLVSQFVGPGTDLVVAGDPDLTTQNFRGATPHLMATAPTIFASRSGEADHVVLPTAWRHDHQLREAVSAVTTGIGSRGFIRHRSVAAAPGVHNGHRVRVAMLRSAHAEGSYVADWLRARKLRGGAQWSDMVVIVRNAAMATAMRRSLTSAGVPVVAQTAGVALRDEPAVRPLLDMVQMIDRPETISDQRLERVLTSPLFSVDAVALGAVRRTLTQHSVHGESVVTLADLVRAAAGLGDITSEADALWATVSALSEMALIAKLVRVLVAGAAVTNKKVEATLWALWEATSRASVWQRQALRGGLSGRRADHHLDVVVALFAAAERFAGQRPRSSAAAFASYIESHELPADTVAEHGRGDLGVEVLTPAGAAGREWAYVAVSGVQHTTWPNTTIRGSLLAGQALADAVDEPHVGLIDEYRQVVDDERRLFAVAVSRATEELIVTCYRHDTERPSTFVDVVDGEKSVATSTDAERQFTPMERPLSLLGMVSHLRRVLLTADGVADDSGRVVTGERRRGAAAELARLAAAGVPGAHPDDWYGLHEISDDRALVDDGEPLRINPSALTVVEQCPLRWALSMFGADSGDRFSRDLGTVIHYLAERYPTGGLSDMVKDFNEIWPSLVTRPETWVNTVHYERALRGVTKLSGYLSADTSSRVLVEQALRYTSDDFVFSGKADRVEIDHEGRATLIDFKTGRQAMSAPDAKANPQLVAYQLAAIADQRQLTDDVAQVAGAKLVYPMSDTAKASVRTQPAVDNQRDAHERLAELTAAMHGPEFVASPSAACRTCQVSTSCPAMSPGRQVLDV